MTAKFVSAGSNCCTYWSSCTLYYVSAAATACHMYNNPATSKYTMQYPIPYTTQPSNRVQHESHTSNSGTHSHLAAKQALIPSRHRRVPPPHRAPRRHCPFEAYQVVPLLSGGSRVRPLGRTAVPGPYCCLIDHGYGLLETSRACRPLFGIRRHSKQPTARHMMQEVRRAWRKQETTTIGLADGFHILVR